MYYLIDRFTKTNRDIAVADAEYETLESAQEAVASYFFANFGKESTLTQASDGVFHVTRGGEVRNEILIVRTLKA